MSKVREMSRFDDGVVGTEMVRRRVDCPGRCSGEASRSCAWAWRIAEGHARQIMDVVVEPAAQLAEDA